VTTIATDDEPRDLSLWRALRAAASALTDDFISFVAGNVMWLFAAGAALLVGRIALPGHALLVLLVPASYGVCLMAVSAVRGRPARLTQLRAGATVRGWSGFWLGAGQLLVLALAVTNATIAVQAPSLPLVLAAVVSGYAGLFVAASVLAIWPLLVDPDRAHLPMRSIARLGFAVIAARPGRLLALVVLEVVFVVVGLQTFVAALVLPALALLVASWVVLTLADELVGNAGRPGTVAAEADGLVPRR